MTATAREADAARVIAAHVAREKQVHASLRAHAEQAGLDADALGTVVDVLDRLAGWGVDEAFPFPTDAFGNPTSTTSSEWLAWSTADQRKDDISWGADIVRRLLDDITAHRSSTDEAGTR